MDQLAYGIVLCAQRLIFVWCGKIVFMYIGNFRHSLTWTHSSDTIMIPISFYFC